MSVYSFRGGPWNGFVIEYRERVLPDDKVRPGKAELEDQGIYLLHRGAKAYVWSDGPGTGKPG
jgi:hypothetical protein